MQESKSCAGSSNIGRSNRHDLVACGVLPTKGSEGRSRDFRVRITAQLTLNLMLVRE